MDLDLDPFWGNGSGSQLDLDLKILQMDLLKILKIQKLKPTFLSPEHLTLEQASTHPATFSSENNDE